MPVGDGRVGVDAAVAQERPVAADVFQRLQVDVADQDFFAVVRCLRRARGRRDRRKTIRPRIRVPGRAPTCRECCRFRIRRDSPPRHKLRSRWHGRAGSFARRRAGPRRTRLSPRDASRSRSDKKEWSRPARPSAARLRDTTDPSRPACRVCPALVSRARKPRSPGVK